MLFSDNEEVEPLISPSKCRIDTRVEYMPSRREKRSFAHEGARIRGNPVGVEHTQAGEDWSIEQCRGFNDCEVVL